MMRVLNPLLRNFAHTSPVQVSVYDDPEPLHESGGVVLFEQDQQLVVRNEGVVLQPDDQKFATAACRSLNMVMSIKTLLELMVRY